MRSTWQPQQQVVLPFGTLFHLRESSGLINSCLQAKYRTTHTAQASQGLVSRWNQPNLQGVRQCCAWLKPFPHTMYKDKPPTQHNTTLVAANLHQHKTTCEHTQMSQQGQGTPSTCTVCSAQRSWSKFPIKAAQDIF